MSNPYICPHCRRQQTDFLKPSLGALYRCPGCGEIVETWHDDVRPKKSLLDSKYICPHCHKGQKNYWLPPGGNLALCPDCAEIVEDVLPDDPDEDS